MSFGEVNLIHGQISDKIPDSGQISGLIPDIWPNFRPDTGFLDNNPV